jgi:hypothetical protein
MFRLRPLLSGAATAAGLLIALGLLALTSTPSQAAMEEDCRNQTTSLCRTVERCSGGFEQNGTCRWIYTVQRYYWKY